MQIERRHICDVGATLLYSQGLEVPGDFEGKVANDMFIKPWLIQNPIRIGEATRGVNKDANAEGMADDEKDKLMAQLQMLGYME